ncbi:chloride channel protein [Anaeramoeba flamelloides]|uniref:Chloride channel protein n=1 Tax=Anaeramoeba flamelloides TaxID=1746091 RepID=A0AAV7YTA1_9EUKA|nr:chloride channel protein [Anaeramoeba flamelloides]
MTGKIPTVPSTVQTKQKKRKTIINEPIPHSEQDPYMIQKGLNEYLDYTMAGNGLTALPFFNTKQRQVKRYQSKLEVNFFKRVFNFVTQSQWWLILLTIGVLCSIFGLGLDLFLNRVTILRIDVLSKLSKTNKIGLYIFLPITVCFSLLSLYSVTFISKQAAGSGIPEMKTILSMILLRNFLSLKTFVSKLLGLCFAFMAGLTIGKEGPYVHFCSLISAFVARLPIFRRIPDDGFFFDILACGCSMGVATVFQSPIGGVLFSIEVTSSFYNVQGTLWRSFFASTFGSAVVSVIEHKGSPILSADYASDLIVKPNEFPFAILIGVLCGLLAAFQIRMLNFFVKVKLWCRQRKIFKTATFQVTVLSLLNSLCLCATGLAVLSDDQIFQLILGAITIKGELGNNTRLVALFFIKFVFSGLFMLTPLSCGIFMPLLMAGATFGRLFCASLNALWPSLVLDPRLYAVLGSASLAGASTQTISTAIVMFELTGQIDGFIPILTSVLTSTLVAKMFSVSIYDFVIIFKGLPYEPNDKYQSYHSPKNAGVICQQITPLPLKTNLINIKKVLKNNFNLSHIPIINNRKQKYLIGSISRQELLKLKNQLQIIIKNTKKTLKQQGRFLKISKENNESYHDDDFDFNTITTQSKEIKFDQKNIFKNNLNKNTFKQSLIPDKAPTLALTFDETFESENSDNFNLHSNFGNEQISDLTEETKDEDENFQVKKDVQYEESDDDDEDDQSDDESDDDQLQEKKKIEEQIIIKTSSDEQSTESDFNEFFPKSRKIEITKQKNNSKKPNNIIDNDEKNNDFEKLLMKNRIPSDEEDEFDILDQKRQILLDQADKIIVDQSPLFVVKETTITQLYYLFQRLGLNFIFVTDNGKFVGLISKRELFQSVY